MSKIKLSYREVKEYQKQDIKKNISGYYLYRHFSTPFTWFFVNIGVSPNLITLSSFVLCLVGFFFLLQGTYLFFVVGLSFFILFKVLDMSDGETARLQNTTSVEGVYFDRISHYLYSFCLGLGIGFGLNKIYNNDFYIFFGVLFALAFILENAIIDLVKSLLVESAVKKKISAKHSLHYDNKDMDGSLFQKFLENLNDGKSWEKSNTFSKIVGVYPNQGLVYSDTFTAPILLVLALIESALSFSIYAPKILGYSVGLVLLYVVMSSISKMIWVAFIILKIEVNRSITKTLK